MNPGETLSVAIPQDELMNVYMSIMGAQKKKLKASDYVSQENLSAQWYVINNPNTKLFIEWLLTNNLNIEQHSSFTERCPELLCYIFSGEIWLLTDQCSRTRHCFQEPTLLLFSVMPYQWPLSIFHQYHHLSQCLYLNIYLQWLVVRCWQFMIKLHLLSCRHRLKLRPFSHHNQHHLWWT